MRKFGFEFSLDSSVGSLARIDGAERVSAAVRQIEQFVLDPGLINGEIPGTWPGVSPRPCFNSDASLCVEAVEKLGRRRRQWSRIHQRRVAENCGSR